MTYRTDEQRKAMWANLSKGKTKTKKTKLKTPSKAKLERCLKKVKKSLKKYDRKGSPYAICKASLGKEKLSTKKNNIALEYTVYKIKKPSFIQQIEYKAKYGKEKIPEGKVISRTNNYNQAINKIHKINQDKKYFSGIMAIGKVTTPSGKHGVGKQIIIKDRDKKQIKSKTESLKNTAKKIVEREQKFYSEYYK